ncbi:hypothetical protein MmTuc01_2008 [Methanosarcina mazei Tuc01]|uniref:Uncharacterized protein n=1 Tax=Methanosarcina mazei Tuc01 TaxID=1236903 RepID=M1PYD5_METMZ|nr:hypothetical protein MmTuc01_2008 [Methanosarcina mazei Tuc01]
MIYIFYIRFPVYYKITNISRTLFIRLAAETELSISDYSW